MLTTLEFALDVIPILLVVALHVPARVMLWPAILGMAIVALIGGILLGFPSFAALNLMLVVVAGIRAYLLRGLMGVTRLQPAAISMAFKEPRAQEPHSADWLRPFMTPKRLPAGQHLFRAGDESEDMFIITKGVIRLVEIDISLKAGDMIGENGIFLPSPARP